MPYLASMDNLRQLDLSDTDITDEGLVQFSRLRSVPIALDVDGTKVTKAGWARFKRQPSGYDSRGNVR